MRILLVSDLHYRLRQFDWLSDAASDPRVAADVIVIAGDLLDIRSSVPIDAQSIAVSAQVRSLGRQHTVLVASGNHDLDSRDAAGEKSPAWMGQLRAPGVHVDGDSVLLDDVLFTICPWWDGPIGRATLDARLAVDAARPKRQWVWIYHAPPTASPLAWDGRRDFGDSALSEWIEVHHPDVILTGHIHQAPFVDGGSWSHQLGSTWLFNAGAQPGATPTYAIIDLTAGTARWASATDTAEVSLHLR